MNGDARRLALLFAYAALRYEAERIRRRGAVLGPISQRVLSALHAMLYG